MNKKTKEKIINVGMILMIFSISSLGMGFIASIYQEYYFYTLITALNIFAWVIALLISE